MKAYNPQEIIQDRRHRVEAWLEGHLEVRECWQWEDLAADANSLYDRLVSLDTQVEKFIFEEPGNFDQGLKFRQQVLDLFREFLEGANSVYSNCKKFADQGYVVDHYKALAVTIKSIKAMLTPDEEYFSVGLVGKRDEAIDQLRSGMTSELI